jgi:flavin-dependent dehydrogenase
VIYVIGAGPAGLAAGLFLIEKGYDVKILEKNAEIKSTACAEGCDLSSLKILPFDSMPYIAKKVKGVKCIFGNKYFHVSMEGVVLNRQKWLEGMAKEFIRRGGEIEFNAKVKKVDDEFIYVNGKKIKYDICIGADGCRSVVKEYFGNKYEYKVGCQYEIKYDTSSINFLELYFDKNYSTYYAWIFPKERSINAGVIGKFTQLDKFLRSKGIEGNILKKQAGLIPCSLPSKLASKKIALIGDAAAVTNPFSLGGIAPAIQAAKILAENVEKLEEYEKKLKAHPICSPILLKGRRAIEELNNEETKILFDCVHGKELSKMRAKDFTRLLLKPSLVIKAYYIAKALLHSLKWGW